MVSEAVAVKVTTGLPVLMFVGSERTGRMVSVTTTRNLPVDVPKPFVCVQFTVVSPIGKSEPDARSQVAPAGSNVTLAPDGEVPSATTISGMPRIGGVPDCGFTTTEKELIPVPKPFVTEQ